MDRQTVVVGMSGGVDSSVSALLLKQQGYRVIALFMKNWEEQDVHGVCRASYEYDDVRRVCDQLDIPYYGINFVEEYRARVFSQFIADFERGLTPNPDILCNREIKFDAFLHKALELGADYLATGHYCQQTHHDGMSQLVKGADPLKDQSYFLYAISQAALARVLFPIGHMEKKEVRDLARKYGLATADKKDSTGICFIGERHFRTFLSQYVAGQPGNFETVDGKVVGQHLGTAYYTLGQRKGLGIGGAGEAWFVVGKEMARNVVYVAQGKDHPSLYSQELVADQLSWISGTPPSLPLSCQAKVRYRQGDQRCTLYRLESGCAWVSFDAPQRAVTPGQSVVFYDGDVCLGGGVIQVALPSFTSKLQ